MLPPRPSSINAMRDCPREEVPMADSEIDDLITMLESSLQDPLDKMLAIGEPALVRLLQTLSAPVPSSRKMPLYPIDAFNSKTQALGVLASKWPDTTISMIRDGKLRMTTSIVFGLRLCAAITASAKSQKTRLRLAVSKSALRAPRQFFRIPERLTATPLAAQR